MSIKSFHLTIASVTALAGPGPHQPRLQVKPTLGCQQKGENLLGSAGIDEVVAWGQYVHWCELQFMQARCVSDNTRDADVIGTTTHWLAAEYVVLEGWRSLSLEDKKLGNLLALYPENEPVLRKFRNAVYHPQSRIMERRIVNALQDENEMSTWSIALHFEFQRFLAGYPFRHSGTVGEREALAKEMALCIGWWPVHAGYHRIREIHRRCEYMLQEHGHVDWAAIAFANIEGLVEKNAESFTSSLQRWNA